MELNLSYINIWRNILIMIFVGHFNYVLRNKRCDKITTEYWFYNQPTDRFIFTVPPIIIPSVDQQNYYSFVSL